MNKKLVIYDIETLSNLFTFTSLDIDSKEVKSFVIWKDQNQLLELLDHLQSVSGMIGFNNLAFDYPVIHFILTNTKKLSKCNGDTIAKSIYKEAQDIIDKEWSQVRYPLIPQLDLFAIHHFNNKAKLVSLKKLEIAMGYENVQDMPYHHTENITEEYQIKDIINYNINDVNATYEFYLKTIDKIELRKELIKKYDIPCINYSDSKIGEELALKLYCEKTKQNIAIVKKKRTWRKKFRFSECIPSYVSFETKEFNGLLEYLKTIEVTELKDAFHYEFEYNGEVFHFGTGGLHQATKEGIYKADENLTITDFDVTGLYPSLIVNNQIYPQHLGIEFCNLFKEMIEERNIAKKNGDKIIANSLKLANNSCFGKFNSEYSWLFDSLATLKTTLAGQLSLAMLIEKLYLNVPNLRMIQSNTDGATGIYDKKHKRLFWEICKEWEKKTGLQLEYASYQKMILRDVNNYLCIDINGKIKRKGLFKLHEEMINDGEWQKGFNQGIVPIALSEYYINNIPVEETIRKNRDIYLFCKSFNTKGNFFSETLDIDDNGNESNFEKQQKTVRYYISNNGKVFRKRSKPLKPNWKTGISEIPQEQLNTIFDILPRVNEELTKLINNGDLDSTIQAKVILTLPQNLYTLFNKNLKYLPFIFKVSNVELIKSNNNDILINCLMDWRIIDIEAEAKVSIFNKYQNLPIKTYDINYDYYINECLKITETINHNLEKQKEQEKEQKLLNKRKRETDNYILHCVNKIPTKRIYDQYRKEWMVDVFPEITEFKKSPVRKKDHLYEIFGI